MNLDTVTVNIRPRSPWEAIDIGFVLARRQYRRLWLLWALSAAPIILLVTAIGWLLPGSAPKWALVLFWLTKPLYELPILIWISRALFGEERAIGETIADCRKQLTFKRQRRLFVHRFSLFRSFSLPVLALEGLEKKEQQKRLSLLKDGYETAAYLSMAGTALEIILMFSLLSILYWLIPEELRWVDFGSYIFQPDNWLVFLAYVISCSLFAPFYVCSGFMMYISRRVDLEAWDIEIGFKRIRQRLGNRKNSMIRAQVSALLLVACCGLTLLSDPAQAAAPDPKTARTAIAQVLEQNDFGGQVTEYRWVPIAKKDREEQASWWAKLWQQFFENLGPYLEHAWKFIAHSGEILLWIAAGILVSFILMKYSSLRTWLGDRLAASTTNYAPPEVLFGMDLRPETLPDDLAATCSQLLADNKKREAISLLYRGTLSGLVHRFQLEIRNCHTEKECTRLVKRNRPAGEAAFFGQLTSLWVFTAYGHHDPNLETCRQLITRWRTLYGVTA